MDSNFQEPEEGSQQSTRPKLAGLDPRALMAEGLSPEARAGETVPVLQVTGFEILRPLGSGGMGSVFLAKQQSLDREVAIKVLHSGQEFATQFYDRLEREARAMATLSHPNIVAVHDFLRLEDGDAAIVMEAIDGGNLRDEIRKAKGPLAVARSVALIRQIAGGLEAAHQVGIVHRDMKPENVLITRDGTAKVTDFGIALPLGDDATRLTVTGTTLGTVAYMAPEQLNGDPVDARADVYSLGVMFYEMLTGLRPQGNFDSPDAINPEIPKEISAAVLHALRNEPEERFQSVREFADALIPSLKKARRLRGWFAAAIAVVALLAAAGSYFGNLPKANLVMNVDPETDSLGGRWIKLGGGISSDSGICILQLPADPLPDSCDVEMEFTRLTGEYSVALFFRRPQGAGSLEVDAWGNHLSGIQTLDGRNLTAFQAEGETGRFFVHTIPNGQRQKVRLEFRFDKVRVFLNDAFQQEVDLFDRELGNSEPWKWDTPDDVTLAIGSFESRTYFHRVEVREVTPEIEP